LNWPVNPLPEPIGELYAAGIEMRQGYEQSEL
jgi:hypothetical protein